MKQYCSEVWIRMFFHNPFINKLTDDETITVLSYLEQMWLDHNLPEEFSEDDMDKQYTNGYDSGLEEGQAIMDDERYKEGYMDGVTDTKDLIDTFIEESRYAISNCKSV
jgi:hypothetical protein